MASATGTIISVQQSYGFIRPDNGSETVFFHRSVLDGIDFDSALMERRVVFETIEATKGPKAVFIRAEN